MCFFSHLQSLLYGSISNCLCTERRADCADNRTADPSAMLQVQANNKGLLIPNVALTSLTSYSQMAATLLMD